MKRKITIAIIALVLLAAILTSCSPKVKKYKITVNEDAKEYAVFDDEHEPGDEVVIKLPKNCGHDWDVKLGDKYLTVDYEKSKTDNEFYVFTFTMPENDVELNIYELFGCFEE